MIRDRTSDPSNYRGQLKARSMLERLRKLHFEGATETFGLKDERGKLCLLWKKAKKKARGKGSVQSGDCQGEGL